MIKKYCQIYHFTDFFLKSWYAWKFIHPLNSYGVSTCCTGNMKVSLTETSPVAAHSFMGRQGRNK